MDEKKTVFSTILNPNVYGFDVFKWKSKTLLKKNNKIGVYANIVSKILYAVNEG